MPRSSFFSRAALPMAVLLALVAAVALVAGGALGRGIGPSPSAESSHAPSAPPSTAPSAPSPQPTVKPSDPPADGSFHVDLANLTGHDVSLVIDDESGTLSGASSGQPGDGMSVRWNDVKVENLDPATLRVVWVGLPGDEELLLSITEIDGTYQLAFVQAAPRPYSDAVGFDRILELDFGSPVSASDVQVTFEAATGSNG